LLLQEHQTPFSKNCIHMHFAIKSLCFKLILCAFPYKKKTWLFAVVTGLVSNPEVSLRSVSIQSVFISQCFAALKKQGHLIAECGYKTSVEVRSYVLQKRILIIIIRRKKKNNIKSEHN
jgi:hypothetical protein